MFTFWNKSMKECRPAIMQQSRSWSEDGWPDSLNVSYYNHKLNCCGVQRLLQFLVTETYYIFNDIQVISSSKAVFLLWPLTTTFEKFDSESNHCAVHLLLVTIMSTIVPYVIKSYLCDISIAVVSKHNKLWRPLAAKLGFVKVNRFDQHYEFIHLIKDANLCSWTLK